MEVSQSPALRALYESLLHTKPGRTPKSRAMPVACVPPPRHQMANPDLYPWLIDSDAIMWSRVGHIG